MRIHRLISWFNLLPYTTFDHSSRRKRDKLNGKSEYDYELILLIAKADPSIIGSFMLSFTETTFDLNQSQVASYVKSLIGHAKDPTIINYIVNEINRIGPEYLQKSFFKDPFDIRKYASECIKTISSSRQLASKQRSDFDTYASFFVDPSDTTAQANQQKPLPKDTKKRI